MGGELGGIFFFFGRGLLPLKYPRLNPGGKNYVTVEILLASCEQASHGALGRRWGTLYFSRCMPECFPGKPTVG